MNYIMFLLLLLSSSLNAQKQLVSPQNGRLENEKSPIAFEDKFMIEELGTIKVYLYNENDLFHLKDSVTWLSHPTSMIFIQNGNGVVKSYSFESELSFVIYDLVLFIEKCQTNLLRKKFKKLIHILMEYDKNIKDIQYECVGNDRYGYWIYYWLHIYKWHDYDYWPPASQNVKYKPTNVLEMHPIPHLHCNNESVLKWLHTNYNKANRVYNLYDLNGDKKYFLLESILHDNSIRYDLIVNEKDVCCFYLTMNSFSALLSEFCKLYNDSIPFSVIKTLCLIDMFYKSPM